MSAPRELPLEQVDVAVIGAGPAGLAAARGLCEAGAGRVVILEREPRAGGVPRHAAHQGFGVRDLHRVLPGPRYAERIVENAARAGAELWTDTDATGWTDDDCLELTRPGRRTRLQARAVVLASGCRERPRSARLIAGSRPDGVMTTGTLQQLVHLNDARPGRRAVIVGAEHVSFSALLTLARGGASTAAIVTESARHQTFAAVAAGGAARFQAPLLTRTALSAIHGRERVEGVELRNLRSGAVSELDCDLVIMTADWAPESELAVLAGASIDPGTRGPQVDLALRTSRPGLFAVGNALQGAEPADAAALSGRRVVAGVMAHLAASAWPRSRVAVVCQEPLQWISPNALSVPGGTAPPFALRASEELLHPHLAFVQDGRTLWRGRLARVMPGRSARVPCGWSVGVDARGGPVVARVISARRRAGAPAGRSPE
jgi:thioredoxin reductase